MSIRIKQDVCVGCRRCIDVCPGSLIVLTSAGKADIAYPKDCWGCASCVKECAFHAIDFYLGADMGGRSSTMNVSREGQYLDWHITLPDGTEKTIRLNTQEANAY